MNIKQMILCGAVALTMGCNSNPYSKEGTYVQTAPQSKYVAPINYLNTPESVDFVEGEKNEVALDAQVANGTAVISVDQLPQGAQFDTLTNKITWTPVHGDGRDPRDPTATSRVYKVLVSLRNSNDNLTVLQQKIVLMVVHFTPGQMSVSNLNQTAYLREMEEYKTTFTINDPDFPQGPFILVPDGQFPQGVILTPSQPGGTGTISFTPNSRFTNSVYDNNCTVQQAQEVCNQVKWNLKIADPHGSVLVVPITWFVMDKRLDLLVETADFVEGQGGNARIFVHAEDPNGESIPTVTLDDPPTGVMMNKVLSSESGDRIVNPKTYVQFDWVGNPNSIIGTTKVLILNVCAGNGSTPRCVKKNITVNF